MAVVHNYYVLQRRTIYRRMCYKHVAEMTKSMPAPSGLEEIVIRRHWVTNYNHTHATVTLYVSMSKEKHKQLSQRVNDECFAKAAAQMTRVF